MDSKIRELPAADTGLAHEAMKPLRPQVTSEEEFIQRVNEDQRPEGYRLVAAFLDGRAKAVSVAGFRQAHMLAHGNHIYIDDLSTLPEFRGQGHAGRILDWIVDEARKLGCVQIHLDSGVDPAARGDAHRLYFNKGMRIYAHHFGLRLS